MRFFRTPSVLRSFYPSLLWRVDTSEKEIYLTFDDGPIHGPTDFVLDTLKSFNAKGTFFCIGDNIQKHPEQLKKIISEGHAVGNHTFNHLNGWRTTNDLYMQNVNECQLLLPEKKLFRPPFGRIKFSQVPLLKKDYQIVMWDILTFDYDRSLAKEKCLRGAISALRPGSIVVFHDSIKAEKNLTYVLPGFMEHCATEGYSFKAL
jgi:peptidoglycan/xylan/chitin deacetylase (PgdA/CDA1 family)